MPDNSTDASLNATGTAPSPIGLPDFGTPSAGGGAVSGIGLLGDVSLQVRIELGRTRMLVEDVL